MKNEIKETYETGATSHAVNDLILFTDNTRALAERRDFIYRKYANPNPLERPVRNPIGKMKEEFKDVLFHYAKRMYLTEFANYDNKHIKEMDAAQEEEFAELYYKDFESWKIDHS